jgi:hypothetical protein
MTEARGSPDAEVLEHRGRQIRLSESGLEWIAFVDLPRQHPTPIMALDREAAFAKACDWIDRQLASNKHRL